MGRALVDAAVLRPHHVNCSAGRTVQPDRQGPDTFKTGEIGLNAASNGLSCARTLEHQRPHRLLSLFSRSLLAGALTAYAKVRKSSVTF
jgi:hypothetical protein